MIIDRSSLFVDPLGAIVSYCSLQPLLQCDSMTVITTRDQKSLQTELIVTVNDSLVLA